MSVIISNCGHDENGRYNGGKAGDQTGTEWQLRSWYSRPWDCVIRFEDTNIAECIATLAEKAARNDLVGYDQNSPDRYTYWEHLKASNYDPAQITIACETDCSNGCACNVKATGFILGIKALQAVSIYLSTRDIAEACRKAGATILTDKKYLTSDTYLRRGDMPLSTLHHICTAVTNGSCAGSGTTATPQPSFTATGTATCTGDGVRIRSGAGTGNDILTSLNKGDKMDIDGQIVNGWYHVRANGVIGYMSGQYVSPDGQTQTPAQSGGFTATGTATCTGNGVRIRSGAGTSNDILTSLNKGNKMDIDGQIVNGWYHVRANGVIGYMSGQYVSPDGQQAASAACTHKVVSGDTLSAIAKKYGTTVNAIVVGNKAKYPKITANYIVAGWELKV